MLIYSDVVNSMMNIRFLWKSDFLVWLRNFQPMETDRIEFYVFFFTVHHSIDLFQ